MDDFAYYTEPELIDLDRYAEALGPCPVHGEEFIKADAIGPEIIASCAWADSEGEMCRHVRVWDLMERGGRDDI